MAKPDAHDASSRPADPRLAELARHVGDDWRHDVPYFDGAGSSFPGQWSNLRPTHSS